VGNPWFNAKKLEVAARHVRSQFVQRSRLNGLQPVLRYPKPDRYMPDAQPPLRTSLLAAPSNSGPPHNVFDPDGCGGRRVADDRPNEMSNLSSKSGDFASIENGRFIP
jgi:hypothetical protein